MLRLFRLAALALVATLSAAAASPIRDGFNANTLARNDDGSTGLVSLGFGVDFYGTLGSSLYVNNNGSVSFGAAMASYSPSAFPISGIAVAGITGIIAPFYADVDTRFGGSPVTYGTGTVNGHLAFGVNWIDVARYYSEALSPERNSFQLVLGQPGVKRDGIQRLVGRGQAALGLPAAHHRHAEGLRAHGVIHQLGKALVLGDGAGGHVLRGQQAFLPFAMDKKALLRAKAQVLVLVLPAAGQALAHTQFFQQILHLGRAVARYRQVVGAQGAAQALHRAATAVAAGLVFQLQQGHIAGASQAQGAGGR